MVGSERMDELLSKKSDQDFMNSSSLFFALASKENKKDEKSSD